MKKIRNKKILIPTLVIVGGLSVFGAIGVQKAFAEDNAQRNSIIERIASRFNLKVDDVQKVFDESRQERQSEMAKIQEEKLAKLVSDGKITEDQKKAILEKCEKIRTEREVDQNRGNMQGMTAEERQSARASRQVEMQKQRSEMEQWLEQNGIDKNLISEIGMLGGIGRGGEGGFGRGLGQ